MSKKYLIIGHGRHGKDTFAEMLCRFSGLKFSSSSEAALDVIFPSLNAIGDAFNAGELMNRKQAFEHRLNYREIWKELISLYNANEKSALCKKILETNDIYVGMRCDKEYDATKHLFNKVFWVDALNREVDDSSMKIKYNESMILIDNNECLAYLEMQAAHWGGIL